MFAVLIKNLRLTKGLNQVQLADKLGVKKQSISNWENDNIMPSVDMLVKIADFFGVTTDYLLAREIQEPEAPQNLDVTGLTERQIGHIRALIDDFRDANS